MYDYSELECVQVSFSQEVPYILATVKNPQNQSQKLPLRSRDLDALAGIFSTLFAVYVQEKTSLPLAKKELRQIELLAQRCGLLRKVKFDPTFFKPGGAA